jgi:DNA repair exonuclease SbcCD nuclease subunit
MKILRLGDPHCTVSNMEESSRLMDFVCKTAFEKQVDRVEILGDLFDTHGVIRAEVLAFWTKWFGVLCGLNSDESVQTVVLVGNHDQKGNKESEGEIHALVPFRHFHENLKIIENPTLLPHNKRGESGYIAYIPHISGAENFLKAANNIKQCDIKNVATHVVCHQTFLGATYENGIFAEDGIDINQVPFDHIISGHIHKSQTIGKCFYPGTARYMKSTDANQKKGFYIFEDEKPIEFISTEDVVIPMYTLTLNEPDEVPVLDPRAKTVLELHGSSQWISKIKKQYKTKASIRSFPSDRKASKVDASKLESIEDYADTFTFVASVSKADVVEYMRGLNG